MKLVALSGWKILFLVLLTGTSASRAQEVIVFNGSNELIDLYQSREWWGEVTREQQNAVPYILLASVAENWQQEAKEMPVQTKKEIFYRTLLPLVLHANSMIEERRARLLDIQSRVGRSQKPTAEETLWLNEIFEVFRISPTNCCTNEPGGMAELRELLVEAMFKVDIIPPALVLGQAAYESGYGTSRFAMEGNALFGQWTFGEEGLRPDRQRAELGDHRIAAFDWPFDSVRSYFININSHPAYEELRSLRAELRQSNEPLDSLVLADGLTRYSERGQEYVDTLKSIIRVNNLLSADIAELEDAPISFIVGAQNAQESEELRRDIEEMRLTGELQLVVDEMALE